MTFEVSHLTINSLELFVYIKQTILAKDCTLGFYEQYIKPIVMQRWHTMNNSIHKTNFSLIPRWYAPKARRLLPGDGEEKEGLMNVFYKMFLDGCLQYCIKNGLP